MERFMVHVNSTGFVDVKEYTFFMSQNGDTEAWGKSWVGPIDALSIEDARRIGCETLPGAVPYALTLLDGSPAPALAPQQPMQARLWELQRERDFNFRRWQDCAAHFVQIQGANHLLREENDDLHRVIAQLSDNSAACKEVAILDAIEKQREELMRLRRQRSELVQAEATAQAAYPSDVQAVAVMLVCHDLDVYLARRNSKTKVYPDAWECPCGKVELGESVRAAALRELREKAPGILYTVNRLISVGILQLGDSVPLGRVRVHLFCMSLQDGDPCPGYGEPTKRGMWQRFSPAALVDHIKTLGPEQNKIAPATRALLSAVWATNNLW